MNNISVKLEPSAGSFSIVVIDASWKKIKYWFKSNFYHEQWFKSTVTYPHEIMKDRHTISNVVVDLSIAVNKKQMVSTQSILLRLFCVISMCINVYKVCGTYSITMWLVETKPTVKYRQTWCEMGGWMGPFLWSKEWKSSRNLKKNMYRAVSLIKSSRYSHLPSSFRQISLSSTALTMTSSISLALTGSSLPVHFLLVSVGAMVTWYNACISPSYWKRLTVTSSIFSLWILIHIHFTFLEKVILRKFDFRIIQLGMRTWVRSLDVSICSLYSCIFF